jgi:hypothetical protein
VDSTVISDSQGAFRLEPRRSIAAGPIWPSGTLRLAGEPVTVTFAKRQAIIAISTPKEIFAIDDRGNSSA